MKKMSLVKKFELYAFENIKKSETFTPILYSHPLQVKSSVYFCCTDKNRPKTLNDWLNVQNVFCSGNCFKKSKIQMVFASSHLFSSMNVKI